MGNHQQARNVLFKMLLIRRVEEAIADAYSKQEMKCPVHLSIGQEAVPAALCEHLTPKDHIYSTHRCHAHYLAKNGSVPAMIAELHGRVTGCCEGKGGSMHLIDIDQGMMGSSALVGGSIPMAVGSALSFSMEGSPRVAVAFFGDGATEEGILFESLNFAALQKLPVLFICENNLYATYSHQKARQANLEIWQRAQGFGLPAFKQDGNDAESCLAVTGEAVARARSGKGPTFIEFTTYRWRDHVGPDFDFAVGYRTEEEVKGWMEKCPIRHFQQKLISQGAITQGEIDQFEAKLKQDIDQAFTDARGAAFPPLTNIFTDVYAQN